MGIDKSEPELKACPFCGADARLYEREETDIYGTLFWWNIGCTKCPFDNNFTLKEKAISAWNTRAAKN